MRKMPSDAGASITKRFIDRWSDQYDMLAGPDDLREEVELLKWLGSLEGAKHLDKVHFVKLCMWKSQRQKSRYESNDAMLVETATRLAYDLDEDILKLYVLMALEGVGVPVASTILHFLHPDRFPIFDVRARSSLAGAGRWTRRKDDQSPTAWLDYVSVMRKLAAKHRVSLRSLDKALFAYDKWGG